MKTQYMWLGRLLCALLVLAPCATVHAGGLYLFDRGARPLSRGGAFVAGADDPSALWYNPAGLKDSGNQLLMDFTLTFFLADYQRTLADGTEIGPRVDAQPMPLPIPTLALSHDFGLEDWTFGLGIMAPNVVLMGWPETAQGAYGVEASPTRYSLIDMRGSLLASLTAGVAYHGIKGLSIGADVQVVAGRIKAKTALTGCDAFACAFPEDPAFDSLVTIDLFPAIAVSGAAGFTYELGPLRIGGSVTFPYSLKGDAHLDIKLPSHDLFENASVKGDKAGIEMKFPWIYRVGAEIRPVEFLRMEGAFVYEAWSTQKEIPITPKGITMTNIRGIGDYEVGRTSIQRNMRDAWSLRGGYELFVPPRWMVASLKLVMRGGLAYERGAFANNALTPFTVDTDKWVISGGLGIELVDGVRIDGVAGWMIMKNVEVRDSQIQQPVAIRPENAGRTVIGNGNYAQDAVYIGGSLYFDLD